MIEEYLKNRIEELEKARKQLEDESQQCDECISKREKGITDACRYHREEMLWVNATLHELRNSLKWIESEEVIDKSSIESELLTILKEVNYLMPTTKLYEVFSEGYTKLSKLWDTAYDGFGLNHPTTKLIDELTKVFAFLSGYFKQRGD